MNNYGHLTYPEISSQAEALQAALEQLKVQRDWIHRYFASHLYDEVIFIGSGSSFYQAQVMASTYRRWLGKSAIALPSSEIFLFNDHHTLASKKYLLVGVSRSGESTEVMMALKSVQSRANWTLCGVTCHVESAMYQLVPCLLSPQGKERSTVMTKSFSSMTFMVQAAIAIASGQSHYVDQMVTVSKLSETITKQAQAFAIQLTQAELYKNYVYLGMATYYGLAQEACLKLKEMSYVWTESYGTLEFRHGPKSIIEKGSFVCVFVSEQARSYELKVAEEMQQYGATLLLVTARRGADTQFANYVFEIGGAELSDDARSVLYLPIVQYFGYYTALKKQVDPDHPRNLTQVVKI